MTSQLVACCSLLVLLLLTRQALSSVVTVKHASTPMDISGLSHLRYTEWIDNDPSSPSPDGFRMATAEITQTRSREGAVAFLARLNDHGTPVGAVELSLIELNECYLKQAPERTHACT
jgi:hypothetical protein